MAIADTTRIGIATPHIFMDGKIDMPLVGRYVRRAEDLGYASLWTQERITGAPTVLDPLSFLSYIAGQTSTARLGVSVVVLPRHNPIHLAKQAADIDQMSGGRLILGVGLGGSANDLLQYGLSTERRVARFLENVHIMRALWTQDGVDYQGDFYQLEDANIEPKPAQGLVPLWFGANVEAAIRRAVKHADGWTGAGSSVLAVLATNIALVQELLDADGRTQADFPISKRMYLAVDDDEARALRRLQEWSGAYYGNVEIPERSAIWGSPARIQEKLAEMAEMGVNEFVLNPVFDYEEQMEQLARITGLV